MSRMMRYWPGSSSLFSIFWKKSFGLKENIEEAQWVGDVEQAKIRAIKELDQLDV